MSFSSDNPQITTQLAKSLNLPSIEDKENFENKLENLLKQVTDAVNSKEGGLYSLEEKGTSSQYYQKDNDQRLRNVYRKTFDLVSLNGGSISAGQTIQFSHEIENLRESAGILANCSTVDGIFFTASYPDICLNSTSVIFTNPYTEALVQCDVTCNYLKES